MAVATSYSPVTFGDLCCGKTRQVQVQIPLPDHHNGFPYNFRSFVFFGSCFVTDKGNRSLYR